MISRGGKGITASTTPLYKHLKSLQNKERKKIFESKSNMKQGINCPISNSLCNFLQNVSKQLSVHDYVENKKKEKMICLDNQQFSLVHNDEFKCLIFFAFSLYTIPLTYFSFNIILNIYSRLRKTITQYKKQNVHQFNLAF